MYETTAKKFNRTSGARKAAVPRREDRPVYGLKTSKNFVVSNAVENILAAPNVKPPSEKNYAKKKDYGKVPGYLKKNYNEIEEEFQQVRGMAKEQEEIREREK